MSEDTRRSDSELVEAFQSGDLHAFDELVLRHQNRVINLCFRMLGHREDADDCAQETFIRVYRSLKKFKFRSAFSTWLYRIAVNTCKNRLASSAYRRDRETVPLGTRPDDEGEYRPREIGDCSFTPNGALERKEREERIQRTIDALPDDQRTVVVLRDIEGLTYEEISGITGLNLGTVKSKIARARGRLRETLKDML
jgi:RNA polymerase sigma-70 factor (ECF subfamily)